MVHMPSLEIWEWGLKIFGSALTLMYMQYINYAAYAHAVIRFHTFLNRIVT